MATMPITLPSATPSRYRPPSHITNQPPPSRASRAPSIRPHQDFSLKSYSISANSIDSWATTAMNSRQDKRVDPGQKLVDPSVGTSNNEQKMEQEIQMLKPNGWKLVKSNLRRIVEYGHREGILTGDVGPLAGQAGANAAINAQNDENDNMDKDNKHDDDVVKITTRDLSLIHAAIPFLPVPVAAFCFVMNVIVAGTGTILSGFCGICMGQPRINFKEGRRFMTLLVNIMVGIAQMGTITFLLVGWFWSMAWGGLLLTHSLQYREALMQHRQEAVATAAIEALTRDAILRRRDVRTLVQERKQGQGAGPDYGRRRSLFGRAAKPAKSEGANGNSVA